MRRRGRIHREVAADRQEGERRPVPLADQAHVAEHVRVAGEVEPEAVLELDDEADRLAEVERRLGAAVEVAGRVVGPDHRDLEPGRLDRAALVHPDQAVLVGVVPAEPQAHLVDARPGRARPAGDHQRVAEVVAVAVGHEQQVAAVDVRPRAFGLSGLPNHGSKRIVWPPGRRSPPSRSGRTR